LLRGGADGINRHVDAPVTHVHDATGAELRGLPLTPCGQTAAQRNAAANAAQLTRFTERDLSRLSDAVVVAAQDFIAAAQARTGESILAMR
jgi:hypothetical protein